MNVKPPTWTLCPFGLSNVCYYVCFKYTTEWVPTICLCSYCMCVSFLNLIERAPINWDVYQTPKKSTLTKDSICTCMSVSYWCFLRTRIEFVCLHFLFLFVTANVLVKPFSNFQFTVTVAVNPFRHSFSALSLSLSLFGRKVSLTLSTLSGSSDSSRNVLCYAFHCGLFWPAQVIKGLRMLTHNTDSIHQLCILLPSQIAEMTHLSEEHMNMTDMTCLTGGD